jgi:hypothetical protein
MSRIVDVMRFARIATDGTKMFGISIRGTRYGERGADYPAFVTLHRFGAYFLSKLNATPREPGDRVTGR